MTDPNADEHGYIRMPSDAEFDLQCAADALAYERDPDDLDPAEESP